MRRYAETIRVHNCRSDDLNADEIGGKADVLVCEIVDDELIGDG